jgi:hypothetical protein
VTPSVSAGVSTLLSAAAKAGAGFRLSGAQIAVSRPDAIPDQLARELRSRRDEVWDHLGGTRQDRPSLELLHQLGVEVAVPQDAAEALALISEMEADADADLASEMPSDRCRPASLLGFDIETAALPDEETRPIVTLTSRGALKASQPKLKGGAGLDPRRATVRLAQLYGAAGGAWCWTRTWCR